MTDRMDVSRFTPEVFDRVELGTPVILTRLGTIVATIIPGPDWPEFQDWQERTAGGDLEADAASLRRDVEDAIGDLEFVVSRLRELEPKKPVKS